MLLPSFTLSNLEKWIERYESGQLLLFDKPLGWTSFDVVKKVKAQFRHKLKLSKIRIGHAGTLDPLATGLLIVCTGKYTKKIEEIQSRFKVYTGTIFLGATTPSYDLETEINQTFDISSITEEQIYQAVEKLTGEIFQDPPAYSAVKIEGKKAYDLARSGKEVKVRTKLVHVHEFEIDTSNLPEIQFRVKCSKGTYIRSLASDLGKLLNSGAYLQSLRREKIGEFSVDHAIDPLQFEILPVQN